MAQRTHTDEQIAAAIETYRLEGATAAAKAHGVHKSTVTRWAQKAGVATVATSRTREATEAHAVSLRERRQEFAELLMDDVLYLRKRLKGPTLAFAFGGRENTYTEQVIPEPPATDVRAIAGSIGTLMTQLGKVIDADKSDGVQETDSMFERIAGGVGMLPFDPDEEESSDDNGFVDAGTDSSGDQSETGGVPTGQQ